MRAWAKAERDAIAKLLGSDERHTAAERARTLEDWCDLRGDSALKERGEPEFFDPVRRRAKLRKIEGATRHLLELLEDWFPRSELFDSDRNRSAREALSGGDLEVQGLDESAYRRFEMMSLRLEALRRAAERTRGALVVRRGPKINVGRAVFLCGVCRELMWLGVRFQTGEETPMVVACSIIWQVFDLGDGARDALRVLDDRWNLGARLRAEVINPQPADRRES